MHNIIRKVMISTVMALLLIVTFGTITFAWIGITSYTRFEPFEITLDVSDLNEQSGTFKQAYGLELSLTGEENSFSTSVNSTELKRNILKNFSNEYNNYLDKTNNVYDVSDETVIQQFNSITLDQATLKYNDVNDSFIFGDDLKFINIFSAGEQTTTKLFKFDLYVSVYQVLEDISGFSPNLNCYLTGNILKGTTRSVGTIYDYTYPTNYSASYPILGINAGDDTSSSLSESIPAGTLVDGIKTVNAVSATRLAFAKHNVVEKNHPEQYVSNNAITELIIYQGGTKNPTVTDNVYSFGGIMEDELNYALINYNKKHPGNEIGPIPSKVLERKNTDIEYQKDNINKLINSSEQINTSRMLKMTVYFWFEGWDADCFDVIDRSPVAISIGLTAYKENDNNGD